MHCLAAFKKTPSKILARMMNTVNSMKPPVVVEQLGAVTTIGINRPEKRNCVNVQTAQLLKDAIVNFENDKESLVAVLYGVGGNFCAGYDLAELAGGGSSCFTHTDSKESGYMGPTHRFVKKPLIAAVSGYAVAGGMELALMCDLRVIEETAIMGVYCRRFGVPLIDGGTVRLTAMVGLSRALDLILTGRSIEAKEAFDWGLANRIVACGTSLGQAVNLAVSLTKFPQACLLADRKSTYNATFCSVLDQLIEYESEHSFPVIQKESVQGATKFVRGIGRHGKTYNLTEKDLPSWEIEENIKHKL
ncbi:hypothetical protein PPYR_06470 [Photinus pyralis]|uniref:Enoyl-CoA hydratase n=2 Tax=Photinus pyralis TaxID=7054 RepID=A0A1Y1JRB2_PHOPY|nr:uncharacterized protein LOC116167260 [Photinus pyralis]KAB0800731.1 hypothetical protein PPYR_06470 [Photinus pyralis]